MAQCNDISKDLSRPGDNYACFSCKKYNYEARGRVTVSCPPSISLRFERSKRFCPRNCDRAIDNPFPYLPPSLPPSATNRRNLLSGNPSWMLLILAYELSSEFLKKNIYIYERKKFFRKERNLRERNMTRVYVSRRKSFTIRF